MKYRFGFVVGLALCIAPAWNVWGQSTAILDRVAGHQMQQARASIDHAPLKSELDVAAYISNTSLDLSPLAALDEEARREFIRGLRFSQSGLASFDYRPLRSLRASQVYKILALFGVQMGTSEIGAYEVSRVDRDANSALMMKPPFELDTRCEGSSCTPSIGNACVVRNCGQ